MQFVGVRRPGSGKALEVEGLQLKVDNIVTATGLELKADPGVPYVYAGFGGAHNPAYPALLNTRSRPWHALSAVSTRCVETSSGQTHSQGRCDLLVLFGTIPNPQTSAGGTPKYHLSVQPE